MSGKAPRATSGSGNSTAPVGPFIVGQALPQYGIASVSLVFGVIAVLGGCVSLAMIETRRRVLEEVSP